MLSTAIEDSGGAGTFDVPAYPPSTDMPDQNILNAVNSMSARLYLLRSEEGELLRSIQSHRQTYLERISDR